MKNRSGAICGAQHIIVMFGAKKYFDVRQIAIGHSGPVCYKYSLRKLQKDIEVAPDKIAPLKILRKFKIVETPQIMLANYLQEGFVSAS